MRTLGVIGGMSWESTQVYYRLLNQGVAARLGGLHSAELPLASLDFGPLAALQGQGRWDEIGRQLGNVAAGLQAAGAEGLLIASNTMHKVVEATAAGAPGLPVLHIGDSTGRALRAAGVTRAGLLGTRFTMEQPFLVDHLRARHGVECVVPGGDDRAEVHRLIFEELCRGQVLPASRQGLLAVIGRLAAAGAEAVVLGCTELGLMIDPARDREALALPAFDSTALHAQAAVDWMLSRSGQGPDRQGTDGQGTDEQGSTT